LTGRHLRSYGAFYGAKIITKQEKKMANNHDDLALKIKQIGNLPSGVNYPPEKELKHLKSQVEALVKNSPAGVRIISGENGPEQEKLTHEAGELNMQLALTRLVTDPDEQQLARLHGEAFQTKYNLSNDQMFTLCRLAIQIGFYEDTKDLEESLSTFARMSPAVKALTPEAAKRLGLKLGAGGAVAGSCSCSCP
jgi:hypothetical protein